MYVPAWPVLAPRDLLPRRRLAKPRPFPLGVPGALHFYVARYALYQLFRALDCAGASVLLPAYHHGNEVRAVRAAGAVPLFYSINRRMEPDLDELERLCRRRPRAMVAIHYLGWPQPIEEMAALCRAYDVRLVEDCALALLSRARGGALGSFGDHAVFCLYKTLPVPNGAVLVQNRGGLDTLRQLALRSCDSMSLVGRSSELMLSRLRMRRERLGRLLFGAKRAAGRALTRLRWRRIPVGDDGFDVSRADLGMSALSRALVESSDYDGIVARRRRNFLQLRDRLDGRAHAVKDVLPEGVCPLFFPLLVQDKARAVAELERRGVEAVPFWNQGDAQAESESGPDVKYLRRHVLELPIHQDLTPAHIEYTAEQVHASGVALA